MGTTSGLVRSVFSKNRIVGTHDDNCRLRALPGVLVEVAKEAKKMGKDDPRKVTHSLKVGLALTLVSLYYYFQPFYDGFGVDAMWAVLTVVLVFEFSVGATMGKLINRTAATLLAGALSVAFHILATLSGTVGKPILLACFIFLVGSTVTFIRFYPGFKARYDYGLMIFILTSCLVTVTGFRENEVWETAHRRLSTVSIGCFIAITVCLCICPVWIGTELHILVSNNIEKLGEFLEGFGVEYFATMEDDRGVNAEKSFLDGYKSVLTSKTTEETMVNLAFWEPCHGRFRFNHPWEEYIKIGTLCRQFAYKLDTINSYLKSDIQTPAEIKIQIGEPCTVICTESGKLLKKLAGIMRKPNPNYSFSSSEIDLLKTTAENLKSLLQRQNWWEKVEFLEIIPAAGVASQLIAIVTCVEKIAKAVHELASLEDFKSKNIIGTTEEDSNIHPKDPVVDPVSEGFNHVITITDRSSKCFAGNQNKSSE